MEAPESEALVDRLRPSTWTELIGQEPMKARLQTQIVAALLDGNLLQHVLLAGPPGMGKTTLAGLIADEMGQDFVSFTMPVDPKVLANVVRTFSGVVLLDELHAAPKSQQEALQPLLEFGYLQLRSGQRLEAMPLTIIGATTEEAQVIPPLRDRFLVRPHIDDYSQAEMARIVSGMAAKAEVPLDDPTCTALGDAAGGVPRNGRGLVEAARALMLTSLSGKSIPTAQEVLEFCRIDPDGLGVEHNAYLKTLAKNGGTMGLRPLCSMLRLHEATIRELEYLLIDRQELVIYTDRGRELTQAGYQRVRNSPWK